MLVHDIGSCDLWTQTLRLRITRVDESSLPVSWPLSFACSALTPQVLTPLTSTGTCPYFVFTYPVDLCVFCRHIFCYIFVTSSLGQLVFSKQNFVYCISCLHCSGPSVDTWNAQGWKTPEELGTVSTLDLLDMWINFAVSGVFRSAKHCACYMRLLSNTESAIC